MEAVPLSRAEGAATCPLCESPMFGWLDLPAEGSSASVGMPVETEDATVVDRCEDCGAAVVRDPAPVDLDAELEALVDPEREVLVAPNRASVQAAIGSEGWAGLRELPGRLLHTRRSLALLAERTGTAITEPASPPVGRSQRWMWQTLVNALTLHPNFATRALVGDLRPAGGRGRIAFGIDAVVTVLAAPLVALVSFPLELIAALLGRGGVLEARIEGGRRAQAGPAGSS